MTRTLGSLGIISDTHNRLDPAILNFFDGVDHILHAGDIGADSILDELALVAPVTAVAGNNDFNPAWREIERRTFNGIRFHLVHIRPRTLPQDTDWLVFGHTHVPFDSFDQGVRCFNPGSAGLANKGAPRSAARLDWRKDAWHPTLRTFHAAIARP